MAIIGTAGWTIPASDREAFPAEGSALERYAARFGGAEINSSFHRPHRASTWERWGASVPDGFQFAVKLPKTITHQHKLVGAQETLTAHLADAALLGTKLTVHLVQLPPSLAFDRAAAAAFFELLGSASPAAIACEPRHASWFEPEADALMQRCRVARVAADPARVPLAAELGGWRGLSYFRLHGSPAMYRSSYRDGRLEAYASAIAQAPGPTWCIFDNTASSAATGDALTLIEVLAGME
ncbi:MAG TPA: DUF72 domain-containing protein [Allosphingosinicella sp.]|nr:DUF72 domain-containing protein [Allosphingosinicella sp.]